MAGYSALNSNNSGSPGLGATGSAQSGEARRSMVVYERILSLIAEGKLELNSRLPSETELARDFGASRPVVREALSRLREDRVIVSRQGSGSYIVRRPDRAMLRFAPVGSIADIQRCFEFRAEVESAAAALAAERRRDEDLDALRSAYESLSVGLGVEEDVRFHMAIAEATHNHYYVSLVASLQDDIRRCVGVMRSVSLLRPPERMKLVRDEHLVIVEAIVAGDAKTAREAMRSHLVEAHQRMFEGEGGGE